MIKKVLLIIFILIILISSVLLLREYKLNSEVYLDNSDIFSQEDIIKLLNKGSTYNNYYRKITTANGIEEYYYKDNILVCYINSELKYWINLSENEKEMLIIDDANNKLASTVENFEEINFPPESSQLGYFSTIYNTEENNNFKYLGKINYNNRLTLIVKTTSNYNLSTYENKYYIDEETGVITKRTDIQKFAFLTIDLQEFDRGIKFDVVTDMNISKPDLQDFSITQCAFPVLSIW